MFITIAGLKHSLGKYLVLSATENIFIIKNSKIVAKLTNQNKCFYLMAEALKTQDNP